MLVYNAQGKLIGRIRLPEVCANVCFGGPKRNHLFMCASQSIYLLQVQTQGARLGDGRSAATGFTAAAAPCRP